ncbi:MAG: alpha/beta hydrolase [Alphaproteobacteria bacterium]|nr:alpha/beta hydrolase [Alphaproteobacteria bacterium]
MTKDDSSFPAPAFVDGGAHYVALNFANIPQIRLPDMAAQVRRAIAWIYRNAASFDGDPTRLFLSGHSSGAHLAAAALVTDWPATHDVPANVIKGALLISGMYDLEAPMLSARSSYVKISKDEEHALSPQRHLDRVGCPVILAHGDGESPEFKRQARDFDAALKQRSLSSTLIEGKGFNHFELVETLGRADGLLGRVALKQMGLA